MADGRTTMLEIRVIPRSQRNELGGARAGRLLVRTTAAPADGAANLAVRRLLAAHFDVALRDVTIVRGHQRRDKTVRIVGARGAASPDTAPG